MTSLLILFLRACQHQIKTLKRSESLNNNNLVFKMWNNVNSKLNKLRYYIKRRHFGIRKRWIGVISGKLCFIWNILSSRQAAAGRKLSTTRRKSIYLASEDSWQPPRRIITTNVSRWHSRPIGSNSTRRTAPVIRICSKNQGPLRRWRSNFKHSDSVASSRTIRLRAYSIIRIWARLWPRTWPQTWPRQIQICSA